MNCNDFDYIMRRLKYGLIFFIWTYVTFLCYVNIENYQDPISSLIRNIVLPPLVIILFAMFCDIVLIRTDNRISAISKIGTDEDWDWGETFEMLSMFDD